MDQKIAFLSALHFLSENLSPVQDEAVRQLRVILSSFCGEVLSEDDYEYLVDSMREERYLAKQGSKVPLTREGVALVHAASERVLGQTALTRLKRMIGDYVREADAYVQRVSQQLRSLQEIRENKVKAANAVLIRVVGLIIGILHKCPDLLVHSFRLDQRIMRNEEFLDSEINYAARKFTGSTGYPIIAHRDNDVLQVTSYAEVASFSLLGQELKAFVIERVRREEVPGWNLQIASTILEDALRELGYLRSRWPGRSFTKYRDFQQVQTNVGCLRECESFNLTFTELRGDQVLVWIESFTSPTKRALDFLHENVQNMTNKQEILTCLADLKLRSIPSGSKVELKDILPNRDLTMEEVPTTGCTFARYWQRTYGIELTEKTQPILVVKGFNQDFHYPAEMVYIDRFSLERYLGMAQEREPKPLSPVERFEGIRELFFSLKDLQRNYQNQYLEVNLQRYVPTVGELCEMGAFEGAVRILPPMLEFYAGSVSLDPLDIFKADYSPVCGKKNISITHLVSPNHITDAEIKTFVDGLDRMFSTYGFGSIQKAEDMRTLRYDVHAGKTELESRIRNLERVKGGNESIAVAIISDDDGERYYSLKRLLPIRTGTPLQCVTLSTFKEILSGRFPGFQALCLKFLIKVLKVGESVWNLSSLLDCHRREHFLSALDLVGIPERGRLANARLSCMMRAARGYLGRSLQRLRREQLRGSGLIPCSIELETSLNRKNLLDSSFIGLV